jgi:dolichol kinase
LNQIAISTTVKDFTAGLDEIRTELFRKTIHMLIGLVPLLAGFDRGLALALLGGGTIIYAWSELLRAQGYSLAFISGIKEFAFRKRDRGRFAGGPVTLALGAMAALLFYPENAAKIAIYALAFGDGLASVAGKVFGSIKIPFTGGKTFEGSFACFLAVYISSLTVTGNSRVSISIAAVVTVTEAFPLGDYDNFIIPITAGYTAMILL